jgi:hypothetical protein
MLFYFFRVEGRKDLSILTLLEDVGQTALSAVLTVMMPSHEDTSTALGVGAFTTKTSDLARLVNLVVLKNSQFDLLLLVLDLLGGGVGLLLALLTTTEQFGVKVESAVVLDTIESKVLGVTKRLTSEGEALKTRLDTFGMGLSLVTGT